MSQIGKTRLCISWGKCTYCQTASHLLQAFKTWLRDVDSATPVIVIILRCSFYITSSLSHCQGDEKSIWFLWNWFCAHYWLLYLNTFPQKQPISSWENVTFPVNAYAIYIDFIFMDKCVEVGPSLGWIKCSVEINYLLTWCRWSFSQRSGCHLLNKYLLWDYIVPWCSSWGIVYQHPYLGMTIVGKIHCSRKTECYRAVFSNIMAHVTILWKKICVR